LRELKKKKGNLQSAKKKGQVSEGDRRRFRDIKWLSRTFIFREDGGGLRGKIGKEGRPEKGNEKNSVCLLNEFETRERGGILLRKGVNLGRGERPRASRDGGEGSACSANQNPLEDQEEKKKGGEKGGMP